MDDQISSSLSSGGVNGITNYWNLITTDQTHYPNWGGGGWYPSVSQPGIYPPPQQPAFVHQILTVHQCEENKPPMRGLFEVFIVDPETDQVVHQDYYSASDEAKARLKAAVAAKLATNNVDDYDFLVRKIGDIRAKKVTQEVKVVT